MDFLAEVDMMRGCVHTSLKISYRSLFRVNIAFIRHSQVLIPVVKKKLKKLIHFHFFKIDGVTRSEVRVLGIGS